MFVKVSNGVVEEYPYTLSHLKRDNPNTSFPSSMSDAILANYSLERVVFTQEPDIDHRTQTRKQDTTPTLVDGRWTIGWSVHDKDQAQIELEYRDKAYLLREQRDYLLAKSDWTALSDSPLTEEKRAEWVTYRQALRDITAHADFPYTKLPAAPNAGDITDG